MPEEARTSEQWDPESEIARLHADVAALTEECRSRAAWREHYAAQCDRARAALARIVSEDDSGRAPSFRLADVKALAAEALRGVTGGEGEPERDGPPYVVCECGEEMHPDEASKNADGRPLCSACAFAGLAAEIREATDAD